MIKNGFLLLWIGLMMMISINSVAQTRVIETATFAGGCFWCMEKPFEKLKGVISVISGYTGGTQANPTYEFVSSGKSDHVETVQIKYDPRVITYKQLLAIYWQKIDPTDSGGQFGDRGKQYRPIIFYHNKEQKRLAEQTKQALIQAGIFDKPITTEIKPFTGFYSAETYHQDYYKKHPVRYKIFGFSSGRMPFLNKVWNKANVEKFYQHLQM